MPVVSLPDPHGFRVRAVDSNRLAHEALVTGDAVYLNVNGKWQKALATNLSTVATGIVVYDDVDPGVEDVEVSVQRYDEVGGWPPGTFTAGQPVYLSQTQAGGLTQTRPNDSTKPIVMVGTAESDTSISLFFQVIQDQDFQFDHEQLDTLVHGIAETCYFERVKTGCRVQSETWYTDNTKTQKIREKIITRSPVTTGKISQIVWKQYDQGGNLVAGTGTLTETWTRDGNGKVINIDMVKS